MIDGVSAATLGEIQRLERSRGRPGEVARDLAWWKRRAAEMCRRRWHGLGSGPYYYGYYGCPCCDYDPPEGRWGLERVLQSLSPRARRDFAAVVKEVDVRVLNATYGGQPDAPGWWEQRI
ncbi:hypothetical protein PS467_17630 [Streptomyces luomodiensis]|uniref:Uncharacterized protein n=1 Tax=Streptomyces luomodiensis TaxID=3026192 RepID=A0ABY9UWT4_9ACTN|nr:hypothetical protein [Streptomyces sp. SCA4-21]WNE97022.1 hypothetical protein PS467_17630 [Streptomyces sp. SCA4-21]